VDRRRAHGAILSGRSLSPDTPATAAFVALSHM
jgi:hypothetical protein